MVLGAGENNWSTGLQTLYLKPSIQGPDIALYLHSSPAVQMYPAPFILVIVE